MRPRLITIIITAFIANCIGPWPAQAQEFQLPAPGQMVHLSSSFNPPVLKGIKVHPDNPFRFDFILDKGDSLLANDQLRQESVKLVKYFLASLTVPEKDLWVNLSPYEKDRIVPESFGRTEMGRDLLAQDYLLKQMTASLIYPEDDFGKRFWDRIYEQAAKRYGTTDIPINTFNKVWIVPEKAVVYENVKAGAAYVVESRLQVMLEQDYLSLQKNMDHGKIVKSAGNINSLGSQIVREIVIPQLTREVNEGKNFARLRQVYQSLILAAWYKKKIKDSILGRVYVDQSKVTGLRIKDPREKEKIYQRYLEAFKKGVYNYIKEDIDPATQKTIPRKYFSGGVAVLGYLDRAMSTTSDPEKLPRKSHISKIAVNLVPHGLGAYFQQHKIQLEYAGDVAKAFAGRNRPLTPEAKLASFEQRVSLRIWLPVIQALQAGIRQGPANSWNPAIFKTMLKLLDTDLRESGSTILPRLQLILSGAVKNTASVRRVRRALDQVSAIHLLNDSYDPPKPFLLFIRGARTGTPASFAGLFAELNGDFNIGFFEYDDLRGMKLTAEKFNQVLGRFLQTHPVARPFGVVGFSNGSLIMRYAFALAEQQKNAGNFEGIHYVEIAPPLGGSAQINFMRYGASRALIFTLMQWRLIVAHNPYKNGIQDAVFNYARWFEEKTGRHFVIVAKGDPHNPTPGMPFYPRFERLRGSEVMEIEGINHSDASNHPDTVKAVAAFFRQMSKGTDKAAISTGGIDFNSSRMDLQLQNSGQAMKFKLDPAMLRQFKNVSGFTPVIIGIQPLTDLKTFLTL